MYRCRLVAIVGARVLLVLRLVSVRLLRGDQLGLGLVHFELLELRRSLCAVRSAKLGARIRKVAGDGVLAEAQALGDVAVRTARAREAKHFNFALGESGPLSALRDKACSPAEFVVASRKPSEDIASPRRS
jgi:hypothetical protein